MKQLIIPVLCLIGLSISLYIQHSISSQKDKLIQAYEQYYSNTEHLLDDLDSAYNWVDGYDSYEYYSSKAKVDSLTNNVH